MEALEGIPAVQFQLYMKLRWAMDAKSRRVGQVTGISYYALREWLEVESVRGRHASESGKPSKDAVRAALAGLERRGLVQSIGNMETLVFLLPKASRVSARPNDEPHMSTPHEHHVSTTDESGVDAGFAGTYPQHEQQGSSGYEPHTSRFKENHPIEKAAAAGEPVVAREPVLSCDVLLPDALEIADWVRLQEKSRGKIAGKVVSGAAELVSWHSQGLTMGELREAYAMAVSDRLSRGSPHPINPGFLNVFVRRVFESRRVSRRGPSSSVTGARSLAAPQWVREAERLGIEPQQPSESAEQFQARVVQSMRDHGAPVIKPGEKPKDFLRRLKSAQVNDSAVGGANAGR